MLKKGKSERNSWLVNVLSAVYIIKYFNEARLSFPAELEA